MIAFLRRLFGVKPSADPWAFRFVWGGRELDRDEKRAAVLVWMGNAVGVCPSLAEHPDPYIRCACQRLRAYGLLYLARDGENPDSAPGYAFTSGNDGVGELVFDLWRASTGYSFGDADKV